MRVGVVQMDCAVGDVAANVRAMEAFIQRSADLGCGLVVLPEMSDTGYLMEAILETASDWSTGPVVHLREAARTHAVHVVAGVSERAEGTVYNAVVSIDPAGEIVTGYRKTHLITVEPMLEHLHLGSGDRLVLSQIHEARVGFMTCYDVRFPEVARQLTLAGAQILVPSAFPLLRVGHWRVLTEARAIENQLFVVAANRIGTDGPGLTFGGTSRVIDPYGTVIAAASEIDETILVCEIDLARIALTRERMQIMEDRRPELYAMDIVPR
jgi:predicted amidohydrolase